MNPPPDPSQNETEKMMALYRATDTGASSGGYRRDKDGLLKWILGLLAVGLASLVVKHEVSLAVMSATMESVKQSQTRMDQKQDDSQRLLEKVAQKVLGTP